MSGGLAAPRLARAPGAYNQSDQQDLRNAIEQRDEMNHKKDRHLECRKGTGIILTDTATGTRYLVQVTSGALALTSL